MHKRRSSDTGTVVDEVGPTAAATGRRVSFHRFIVPSYTTFTDVVTCNAMSHWTDVAWHSRPQRGVREDPSYLRLRAGSPRRSVPSSPARKAR